MRKVRILLILGIWVMILPYLGFSYSWKDKLFTLSGLGLVCLSYTIYKDYKIKEDRNKICDNFSENSNFNDKEV